MTDPLFYVDALDPDAGSVAVEGTEGRHAATVRRLRVGEPVDLADGAGGLAHGVVAAVGRDRIEVRIDRLQRLSVPQPRIVVVQALPKGERAELAVEGLTEVGVDVIVPWAAARCVTRWDDARQERGLTKWRTTAREAGKQARRARLPVVTDLASTATVLDLLASAALGVVLHESAVARIAGLSVPDTGDVVVVVGPEGGLTDVEVETFVAVGAHAVRLGPIVLRTSTAGMVAAGVLQATTTRWA